MESSNDKLLKDFGFYIHPSCLSFECNESKCKCSVECDSDIAVIVEEYAGTARDHAQNLF
jgi:hypothetical protein